MSYFERLKEGRCQGDKSARDRAQADATLIQTSGIGPISVALPSRRVKPNLVT